MGKNRIMTVGAVALTLIISVAFGGVALSQVVDRWERPPGTSGSAPGTEQESGPGNTDDVVIVGDSITEMSESTLRSTLGEKYRMRIRGRGGYRIEEMEPYAIELAATGPEQVLINLGTNDILRDWPIDRAAEALERMIKDFSAAHCVHVVTINETFRNPKDPGLTSRARQLNFRLRKIAADHHVNVIDWSALVIMDMFSGSPEGQLTEDSVHPNARGQKLLAGLYQQALDGCD